MHSTKLASLLVVGASVLGGCKEPPREVVPEEVSKAPASATPTCARSSPPREKPLDASGSSSSVALARRENRTLGFVADADDRSIHVIDVDMALELSTTPVAGRPSALVVLSDGRLAASLEDEARVELFEAPLDLDKPLERRCGARVATEPTGLALTPDGATLLVASRWGHALTALATSDLAERFAVELPRDPRAVTTSSDGKKAFVAHVVGSRISVVDLEGDHAARAIDLRDRQVRPVVHLDMDSLVREFHEDGRPKLEMRNQRAGQGYAIVRAGKRILAPEAMVDPGNGVRSRGYGEARTAFGDVAAIVEATEKRARKPAFDAPPDDCLLPRAAAIDAEDDKLVVACAGLDALVVYGASKDAPHDKELRRLPVGAGPTGLAIDDSHRAVAWSSFDRSVAVVDLRRAKGETTKRFSLGAHDLHTTLAVVRGRQLFHMSGGGRVAFDGRACASCHPDGRDDGVTWTTPDGPRQTPMLMGRLEGTAPFGWSGASKTVEEHLKHTFDRLAGKGLSPSETSDLFAFIATLGPPDGARVAPPGEDRAASLAGAARTEIDPLVRRGEEVFRSSEAGCASCHLGDELTDHARHDVKSRATGDSIAAFDTPSLRFVDRSAPYYHDGRFATLEELLAKSDGKMGHTKALSKEDASALLAYLRSL